jgi:D-3-phosphoglycerate dehydrogenase
MSKTRILITTTSFQDTPGRHHDLLPADQFEIDRARGPLAEADILRIVGTHDAIICGDDAFTKPVLEKCLPKLKVLAKYGIGVDKIDVAAATAMKIPVTFCPGVNHVTVAEHTFGLLLSLTRLIPQQDALIKKGEWKRSTGREIAGKTMGILGLGRIGKEVAKRAKAFDMNVCAFDLYWEEAFA